MASTKKGGDKQPAARNASAAAQQGGTSAAASANGGGTSAERLDVEADSRYGAVPAPGDERGVRVEEVMSTEVVTAAPSQSVADAARLMRDNDVGFLPVCDDEGSVLGVVTDRDLVVRALADDLPATTRLEDVMSEDVAACHAGDDLGECERLMRGNQVSRMVVLGDEETLVGIVSIADLANNDEDDQRLGDLVADVKTSELGR